MVIMVINQYSVLNYIFNGSISNCFVSSYTMSKTIICSSSVKLVSENRDLCAFFSADVAAFLACIRKDFRI